jgi:hypothetical protein
VSFFFNVIWFIIKPMFLGSSSLFFMFSIKFKQKSRLILIYFVFIYGLCL